MSPVAIVVEDNETSADIAVRQLEAIGFEAQVAETAESGWNMIQEVSPDLVVIDERLPDTSGIELIKTVRNNYPGVTIVMSTIVDDERSIKSAFAAGCNYYAIKPNGLRKLCQEMESADALLSVNEQQLVKK